MMMDAQTTVQENVYCCRLCSTFLFTSTQLSFHEPKKHQFSWRKKRKQSNSVGAPSPSSSTASAPQKASLVLQNECNSLFLQECPEWRPQVEGKIHCPKCKARVGSFSWSGAQCSCGTWVTPAICFQRARVDMKYRNEESIKRMRNQVAAISDVDSDGREQNLQQSEDPVNTVEDKQSLNVAISELTEMGFEESLVRVALKKNGNDLNEAMAWLFSPSAMEVLSADGELLPSEDI